MRIENPFRLGFGLIAGGALALLGAAMLAVLAVFGGMAWGGIPGVLAFLVVLYAFGIWGGIAITLAFAVLLGIVQQGL